MNIMVGMRMGTRQICTSTCPLSYLIKKVGYFPYSYTYTVNVEIFRQNGNEFKQYSRKRVYLPSCHPYASIK